MLGFNFRKVLRDIGYRAAPCYAKDPVMLDNRSKIPCSSRTQLIQWGHPVELIDIDNNGFFQIVSFGQRYF